MNTSQNDNPKKTVKEFYGTMFEIFANPEGWIKARPTQDPQKAVDIVTPVSKKICAYCPTDKCLSNIVGERMVFPEHFKEAAGFELTHIEYFDIAKCKQGQGKIFFIVIRDTQPRILERGRCIWCKSPYVEKMLNIADLRKNISSSDRVKKYNWVVWKENAGSDEETIHAQMEGLKVDEVNTLLFKAPWKCKHCYRIFGHEGYDPEGRGLFNKLVEEVRMKDLKESFARLRIPAEKVVFKHAKCPNCLTQFDYDACESECLLELIIDPAGFYIAKRKCAKCNNQYFVVSDVYDMHKRDKKYQ
ncbi:MAG: hypothetical protein NTX01_03095 [Candidatus Omnitrophica bacterium]|nr:hypothetical protein [Candidatus Omnitrophota bacterium]